MTKQRRLAPVRLVAAIAFAACLLSGCNSGRKCIDWDTQWTMVTTQQCTTTTTGKTTTTQCHPVTSLQPVTVCVKYEEPTPTPSREPQ